MSFDPHSSLWNVYLLGLVSGAVMSQIAMTVVSSGDRARAEREEKIIRCTCGHQIFAHQCVTHAPYPTGAKCSFATCSCAKFEAEGVK